MKKKENFEKEKNEKLKRQNEKKHEKHEKIGEHNYVDNFYENYTIGAKR